ncbi:uncharacterized protein TNCV_632891 [Trichonephila clavipes]|nr:uncharacterized protein TNCV_632891 [Trichonephila clavipes]
MLNLKRGKGFQKSAANPLLKTLLEGRKIGAVHFRSLYSRAEKSVLSSWRVKTDSEVILTMSVIVNESNISKQLSEFWDLENLGIEAEVSGEENIDNDIMSEFEAGISYQNKRYKVKFPWKPNTKTLLENNEEIARKRFL